MIYTDPTPAPECATTGQKNQADSAKSSTARTWTKDDLRKLDRLQGLVLKQQALLAATFGTTGESFRNLNDSLQDCFLWTCSDMADEICNLVNSIEAATFAQASEVQA